MQEVAVVCSSMKRANCLMNYAIDKAPKVFKKRGRDYLLTANNVKYVFMSYQNCERKLIGFRGFQLRGDEFEKMFTCGFTEVKGEG